ncbi:F-box domain-containing protein [Mycena indigotica]|uniref:F-box domain-containing protein n=1 Tax=Mycena indigotica TaxID=2126181 RepID=A0A8H6SDA5_9AGAR|nr:F-box domain-containing protein [Mycena indigotica]KAF7297426.1 F-box domain-containing protein [Mycena indigotica]
MHPLFSITEIVDHVVLQIKLDSDQDSCSQTLARLARCCRAFEDPALDRLWSTLKTLDYLVQCLPDGCWEQVEYPRRQWLPYDARTYLQLRSTTSIPEEGWGRVLHYSRRVKCLFLGHVDRGRITFPDSSVFRAFGERFASGELMPNLRALHCSIQFRRIPEFFSLGIFVAPQLSTLALSSDKIELFYDLPSLHIPFAQLEELSLEDLSHFQQSYFPGPVSTISSVVFPRLNRLRKIVLNRFDPNLTILAALPCLQDMSLTDCRIMASPAPIPHQWSFRSLRSLHISDWGGGNGLRPR